ncbi:conserved hypothetical protein [uncultured Eubacteriales bacterium]|uniref:Uncharacterized protein n=1 Tax=uncultured Eubacteriales bacterium TaxID=172733 RepID=A0A212JIQ5_9FIRM|nr:conserved hypothetical protein [uncultured Eubacteriales bacterium]
MVLFIYAWAGYWAAGQVLYKNKIVFRKFGVLFFEKLILGIFLGWILIPIALIRIIFGV